VADIEVTVDDLNDRAVVETTQHVTQIITDDLSVAYVIEVEGGTAGQPGLSAYDLAVLEGFVGTRDQWLDTLVSTVPGPPGEDGEDGGPGPQGEPGPVPLLAQTLEFVPGLVWESPHALTFKPANVTVRDSAGTIHHPENIEHYQVSGVWWIRVTHRYVFGGTVDLS
jgi:hypothetical protein